ncbi:MAG TPA: hypothetical protein VF479_08435 [Pseudolysinimonas sp.]
MFSRRALGIAALAAVILAAISFAVVDVSIAEANGCIGVSGPCADTSMPFEATAFAIVGLLALMLSVIPAAKWVSDAMQHAHHDAELESMRLVGASYEDDEK